MPAAAVIPAPVAYSIVVAVKKLVVGMKRPCLQCYGPTGEYSSCFGFLLLAEFYFRGILQVGD